MAKQLELGLQEKSRFRLMRLPTASSTPRKWGFLVSPGVPWVGFARFNGGLAGTCIEPPDLPEATTAYGLRVTRHHREEALLQLFPTFPAVLSDGNSDL